MMIFSSEMVILTLFGGGLSLPWLVGTLVVAGSVGYLEVRKRQIRRENPGLMARQWTSQAARPLETGQNPRQWKRGKNRPDRTIYQAPRPDYSRERFRYYASAEPVAAEDSGPDAGRDSGEEFVPVGIRARLAAEARRRQTKRRREALDQVPGAVVLSTETSGEPQGARPPEYQTGKTSASSAGTAASMTTANGEARESADQSGQKGERPARRVGPVRPPNVNPNKRPYRDERGRRRLLKKLREVYSVMDKQEQFSSVLIEKARQEGTRTAEEIEEAEEALSELRRGKGEVRIKIRRVENDDFDK